jgi:hypothetical protein
MIPFKARRFWRTTRLFASWYLGFSLPIIVTAGCGPSGPTHHAPDRLIRRLKDPDAEIRLDAAPGLGDIRDARPVEPLIAK